MRDSCLEVLWCNTPNHGQFIKNVGDDQAQFKGVKNGTFGTIEAYDSGRSELRVKLEGNRCVCFDTREYTHITHGYAMGIHKSEGSTFDKSFVSLDPLLEPSTLLVAMTRHREDVQVYISREQFIDFRHVVDRIGRIALKETVQDYHIPEDQKPTFNRVQQYRDLIIESANLREKMEGSLPPTEPLHKHPSYSAYQTCFEEKKRIATTILEDWKVHAPYTRLAGIRKDVLEVEACLRPRLLSDLEHRASIQVEGYMDLVVQTRTLWKDISQTHPGALAHSHGRYEEYKEIKTERDSLASIFQENQFKKLKECEGTPQADAVRREIDHFASSLVKDKAKFDNLKTVYPAVAEAINNYLEPQVQIKAKWKGYER